MIILNKLGYDPIDNNSSTGYRRPPTLDAACICDYFATLGTIEDDGQFLHQEMQDFMSNPQVFCTTVEAPAIQEEDISS